MRQLTTNWLIQFRNDKFLWLITALAILGAALILLREINYGVGIRWDEAGYILRARAVMGSPGWIIHLSGIQPPLFPVLLAVISLPGFNPVDTAGFVNAGAFGLTIIFSGLWLRNKLDSGLVTVWGTLAVMLSIPLTTVAALALTEPLFALLTLLALIQTEKFLGSAKRSSLIWAAVFTALACLTRYMGFTIAVSIVLLLLFHSNTTLQEKARRIVLYSFIALTPLFLFWLRNTLLDPSVGGLLTDWTPTTPLSENLRNAWAALIEYAIPLSSLPTRVQDIFAGLLALALCLSVITAGYAFLRRRGAGAPVRRST